MASTATPKPIPVRIFVDKEENRVLFAEAGKDFADAVLSFLTLPLGTIARLVSKDSNKQPVRFGCISSLFQSVANLDPKYFSTAACKEMLLQPRNPMESYCQNLKLNIDNTEPVNYFVCRSPQCRMKRGALLSTFRNQICHCGKMMTECLRPDKSITKGQTSDGYVQETATFIISDDLIVMPSDLNTTLGLLRKLGNEDAPKALTVNVSQNELVDLLKCSLLSKKPLTDLFLRKKQSLEDFQDQGTSLFKICVVTANEGRKINVRVVLTKSKGKILFAQVKEDFMDLLLSFLTLPLGAVERVLEGNSCLGSMDNLFASVADLNASRHFKSEEIKRRLINPGVAPQFNLHNQILPIDEVIPSPLSCYTLRGLGFPSRLTAAREYSENEDEVYSPLTLLDPKCPSKEISNPGGFAKGPSIFMVTDDLIVNPFSYMAALSFLIKSKVPVHDLEESVISICVKEVKGILKASLISTSALTTGLRSFTEVMKEEK